MPAKFDACLKNPKSKVVTIKGPNKKFNLKKGEYMHLCILGKKFYRGEVKKKKK